MRISIRQATSQDAAGVSMILQEAATWLIERGTPLWQPKEVSAQAISADIASGLFFLAEVRENAAPLGTMKFQLEDPIFWPDVPVGESAYVHRLAVRRNYARGFVSTELLRWAVERARNLDRRFLRLDCESGRPRLRAVYERFGFTHHSDRQVGPYHVSRYQYAISQGP